MEEKLSCARTLEDLEFDSISLTSCPFEVSK